MNDSTGDLGFTSMAELAENALADLKERARRCAIEDGFIIFKDFSYEIALERCDTYAKLLGWQLHLSEKSWMTTDLLMQFTIMVCEYHQLPIARGV